ncbi:hypothetical protein EMPS_06598 [Entomortierella parvispora]|uniref:F-box domain-containing protein n=1 Tax=Entomortierella parvispora TaxID=205924 RepID=A0A9P3HCY1_9FUNG|nr:hypothetical protein EMPS_06598 [Entomortierella parvispora]
MASITSSISLASALGEAPSSPLDVPEIIAEISKYLSPEDTHMCLFVNKAFHMVFARLYWQSVQIGSGRYTPFATPNSVGANARLVQSLAIQWGPTQVSEPYLSINFAVLREFKINVPLRQRRFLNPSTFNTELSGFLSRHKSTIRVLSMVNYTFKNSSLVFWKTVSRLQALSTLDLDNVTLEGSVLGETLFKVFSTLQSLRLRMVRLVDLNTPIQENGRIVLKRIEIRACCFDPESLGMMCHLLTVSLSLRVLMWGTWIEPREKGQTVGTFEPVSDIICRGFPWKDLYQLDINNLAGDVMVKTVNAIARGIPSLKLTHVTMTEEGKVALLQNIACNLTTVEFKECDGLKSDMVQDVLCSCKDLLSITVDIPLLSSSIVQSSKPWACSKLRKWKISVQMDKEDEEDKEGAESRHGLIFMRLSRLVKLRVLDVSLVYDRSSEGVSFLMFKESSGVRTLSTLALMEVLKVRHTGQQLSRGDWEWLLQTFSGLHSIIGFDVASGDAAEYSDALQRRAILNSD